MKLIELLDMIWPWFHFSVMSLPENPHGRTVTNFWSRWGYTKKIVGDSSCCTEVNMLVLYQSRYTSKYEVKIPGYPAFNDSPDMGFHSLLYQMTMRDYYLNQSQRKSLTMQNWSMLQVQPLLAIFGHHAGSYDALYYGYLVRDYYQLRQL